MGNQTSKKKQVKVAKAVRVTLKSNETKEELMKKYKERNPNPEESVYNILAFNGSLDELKVVLADESSENLKYILNTLQSAGYGPKEMFTPLMTAAKYGNLEIVNYLLSLQETDPAVIDNQGRNALHHAAVPWEFNIQKRSTIVRKLTLRLGIEDINKIDEVGFTPLDLAFNKGEVSEGYKNFVYNTIYGGKETGEKIRDAIIFWIQKYGGKANWHDENGRNVGRGNGDLNADHLPSFQRKTDMKF